MTLGYALFALFGTVAVFGLTSYLTRNLHDQLESVFLSALASLLFLSIVSVAATFIY